MKNGSVGSSLCQLRRNEFEPSLPPPRIPERKRYLGLPRDFLRKWTRVFLRIIITTDSERFELLSPIVDLSITSPGGRMSLARRRFDGIVLISFARGFLIRRVFGAFWRATKKNRFARVREPPTSDGRYYNNCSRSNNNNVIRVLCRQKVHYGRGRPARY